MVRASRDASAPACLTDVPLRLRARPRSRRGDGRDEPAARRPGRACGCSSAAGTRPTRRSLRPPYSASLSRCRPASAATASRSSGATGESKGSTRPARRRARPSRSSRSSCTGRGSVTVPGAVAGWAAFAERYGRLGLDACLQDAIDAAERASRSRPAPAESWQRATAARTSSAPAPRVGEIVRFPSSARRCGDRRRRTRRASTAARSPRRSRARPGSTRTTSPDSSRAGSSRSASRYRGTEVLELPPPTQGVAALEALGLLERSSPSLASRVRCASAGARGRARTRARRRRRLRAARSRRTSTARRQAPARSPWPSPRAAPSTSAPSTATAWPCLFIQSLFEAFGSRRRRARHRRRPPEPRRLLLRLRSASSPGGVRTTRSSRACSCGTAGCSAPFGVMGGFIQAQAHMQLVSAARRRRARSAGGARPSALPGRRAASPPRRGALGRATPTSSRSATDRARDRPVRLRRRAGDPRPGRGARRRLGPAQGRLRGGHLTRRRARPQLRDVVDALVEATPELDVDLELAGSPSSRAMTDPS